MTKPRQRGDLTEKQRLFAHEYVVDMNGAQAAVRAGCPAKNARVMAAKWLAKPNIKALVVQLQAAKIERVESKADRVLRRIEDAAELDPGDFFNVDGSVKPIHEIPLAARRALVSMDVEELFEGSGEERVQVGVVRKLRWRDPMKGDELLAKHHGLLREIVEVQGKVASEDVTDEEWAALAQLRHEVRRG